MHLLQTCPIPQADYGCLSILMDNSVIDLDPFVELTTIASPLSTTSPAAARLSLVELHKHLGHGHANDMSHNQDTVQLEREQSNNQYQSNIASPSLQAQHEALMNELGNETETNMQMNDNEHLYDGYPYPSRLQFHQTCISEDEQYRHHRQTSLSNDTCRSYRSQSGMVVYYILVRDKGFIQKCISSFQPVVDKKNSTMDLHIHAIVISVGVTGSPYSYSSSPHIYKLRKRLKEFALSFEDLKLCKVDANANANANATSAHDQKRNLELMLLSLLMDDESLKTNAQFDAEYGSNIDSDTEMILNAKNNASSKPKLFPKKFTFAERRRRRKKDEKEDISKTVASTALISPSAPSSEVARIVSDQMQVLSLAEKGMKLRGYEQRTRQNTTGKSDRVLGTMKSPQKSNRRLGRDLAGFDYVPPSNDHSDPIPAVSTASSIMGLNSVASDATSVTATTMSTDSSASGSIPTLSGPSRDSSSTKRQLRRNKVMAASIATQHSRAWNQAVSLESGGLGQSPQRPIRGVVRSNFDPFAVDESEHANGDQNGNDVVKSLDTGN